MIITLACELRPAARFDAGENFERARGLLHSFPYTLVHSRKIVYLHGLMVTGVLFLPQCPMCGIETNKK